MTEKIFDQMGAPAPSPAEASTEETTPAPSEMVEKSDDVPTSEPIVSATVETSVSTELYFMVELYDKKTDKVYAVSAGWFKSEDDAKDWIDQNGEQYKTVFASKDLDLGDNPMLQRMINISASYDSNETFSHPYMKEKIELRKRDLSFRVKSMKHFLSNLDDYYDNTKASEQSLKCTPAIETPTMVEKSNDDVPTATAEPSTNTVPTEDKATEPTSETVPTLEVEPSPELTIEGATEEAIADTAVLASNEVKAGNKAPLKVPTYAELKQSELYMPIVDIERLNDDQLVRAAQNKLAGDMDVRTFIYCWLHFAFRDNHDFAKQFLVKSKCLDKGIDYIKGKLKKVSNGAVGIGEGKVIELFLEYLRLDDAYIAAEKAKEEAARKKKAEAARAKAKEKKSKKTESKPSASAKAKSDDKAAEKKPSTKKKASKAATEESVLSLFSMM